MPMNAVLLRLDPERVIDGLQEALARLDGAEGELVLDFCAVGRIDSNALRELEKLAGLAEAKGIKVVLRGVNIDTYKVLKLMKLTARFAFQS